MVGKIVGMFFLLLILSVQVYAQSVSSKKDNPLPLPEVLYKADEILIQFDDSIKKGKVGAAGIYDKVRVFAASQNLTVKAAMNRGWHRFLLPPGQSVDQAIASLKNNSMIKKIEPNYIVRAAALSTTYTPTGAFNDPLYTDGSSQWWVNRIKADQAYNAGYVFQGSSNVVVAVIDTGVDLDHTDFSGRLVSGYNVIVPASQPDDDNDYTGGNPRWGHGTHVAGMIAANVNNSAGVAGAAWNNYVKIMPVKALDSNGDGTIADYVAGIDWAVANGARILNLSVEIYSVVSPATLETAINDAVSAGCLVVAASGNSNRDINASPYCYPAVYGNVFTVGATTSNDYVTFYSNYSFTSGFLDVVAPGGAMIEYSAVWDIDYGVTSTANTGGWTPLDGTSFAAPQVAALAAMLWLQVPSRTADDIKTIIKNTCEDNPDEFWQYDGSGKVDVLAALGVYKTSTPTITFTSTYTKTITQTVTPSYTPTFTRSPTTSVTPTYTRTQTFTPSATLTVTLTATPTVTLTATPTITLTATESATATPTVTLTTTPTATLTATESVTPSPTITLTSTKTITLTATESATATPTATLTVTPTPTLTATESATTTYTSTITYTSTVTPTFTVTPSPTASVSPTPTFTVTLTATESATATLSATTTHTATHTLTYTASATLTYTPTVTRTGTLTVTGTSTPTFTVTPTSTITSTGTITTTYTVTPTVTQTNTIIITKTVTVTRTGTVSPTCTPTPTIRLPSDDLSNVVAFPNPWRGDIYQQNPRIVFAQLPVNASVTIYSIDGKMIKLIEPGTIEDGGRTNNPGNTGRIEWGMTSRTGQAVASGIYVYVVKDSQGNRFTGKVAIVR